jgi:DHA1 family bicyclomycin/chloramphenicol resistance-like MFS transporter
MSTEGAPASASETRFIIMLGTIVALAPLSLSIHIQSIPAIAVELDTSYPAAQMTVSLFLFTVAAAQFLVGPLSDRLGRRPVLFGGLAVFAAAGWVAAVAPSIEVLLAARIIQATGGCAALVTPRAVVQDRYRGAEAGRIMAYVAILQSCAPIMAPVIGGAIETVAGWRGIFAFLGVYAVAIGAVAVLRLPESRPLDGGKVAGWTAIFRRYAALLASRRYIAYTAVFAFGTTGYFGFLATGPAVMISELGLEPWQFSAMLTTISIQFVVGGYAASRIVMRFGVDPIILVGAGVQLVSVAVFWVVSQHPDPVLVTATFCLYALSNGLVFSTSLAGATSIDPRVAGSAASFLGAMQFLVGGAIALTLAELPTANFGALPLVLTILAAGAFIAALEVRRTRGL